MSDEHTLLRHEVARLRHELQDRAEIMESQHGPVAYRRWDSPTSQYEFMDAIFWEELEQRGWAGDEWEPLYVQILQQKAI